MPASLCHRSKPLNLIALKLECALFLVSAARAVLRTVQTPDRCEYISLNLLHRSRRQYDGVSSSVEDKNSLQSFPVQHAVQKVMQPLAVCWPRRSRNAAHQTDRQQSACQQFTFFNNSSIDLDGK